MDRYLEGEEISSDVLTEDLEKAVARATFFPVVPVCSVTGVGCAELLDLAVTGFPSPQEHPSPEVFTPAGAAAAAITCDPKGPLVAEVLTISATSGSLGSQVIAAAVAPAGVNTSGEGCSSGDGKPLTARSSSSAHPTPVTEQTGTTGWKVARATAFSRSSVSDVVGDLLAPEVAVHQGLVLGLLDDALDQGAAQVFVVAVVGSIRSTSAGDLAVAVAHGT